MRRFFRVALNILSVFMILTACSKDDRSTSDKIDVHVLFSPEGFCNMSYSDIILKSIEKSSQKYGFGYSFYVPDNVEKGMGIYNSWLEKETENNCRSIFIFASAVYGEPLAQAQHPTPDTEKEILLFETEEELPYAYTFAISYYGASYFISSYFLKIKNFDFKIIAANPYTSGLNYVYDGFYDAINDNSSGTVEVYTIGSNADEGFDNQIEAYIGCKILSQEDEDRLNIYIPYAGVSNMGVYRFSEANNYPSIGVDAIDPNYYTFILMSMNKRVDLALDDFFSLWTKGEEVPRHRLYTLESGRAEVIKSSYISDYDNLEELELKAISKENEYFGLK